MNKLKLGLIAASTGIVGSVASGLLWNGVAHGEWDLPGLQQQVAHVTEVTSNHEARITNLENAANTPSGQPTPAPQVVTKVVTQAAPQTAPASAPVVASATIAAAAPVATPAPVVVSVKHLNCVNTLNRQQSFQEAVTTFSDGTATATAPDGQAETRPCGVMPGSW
jgi:hypothetical protein